MTLTDAHITRPGAAEPSERRIKRRHQPAVLRQRCLDCARAGRGPAPYQTAGLALLRAEQQGADVLARVELLRMATAGEITARQRRDADEVLALIGVPIEVQQDIERGPVPA